METRSQWRLKRLRSKAREKQDNKKKPSLKIASSGTFFCNASL